VRSPSPQAFPPDTKHTYTEDILSILSQSTAARHPSNANPTSSTQSTSAAPSLTARLAQEAHLDRPTQTRELVESERRAQYQRQIFRKWQPGDVYAPHDLSGVEQKKWKFGRKRPQEDAFDILGVNPVLEYKVGG
jgi:small subunit ribosomal protein S18